MRLKLAVFILFFFVAVSAKADTKILVKPGSPMDIYLDEIAFNGLQLDAVVGDMYLYTGWDTDDKKAMREDSIKVLKHLDAILEDIDKQKYPKELASMKDILINTIKAYKDIYTDIDKKDIKAAGRQIDDLWDRHTEACKKLYILFDLSLTEAQFDKAKDPSPVFESKELEASYKDAVDLLKQKKYRSAFEKLSRLRDKLNKESVAYDFVTEHLCDVVGKSANGDDAFSENEEINRTDDDILKYSEEIFSKNYSPLFCDFFVIWRTIKQELYSGMSNWSQIPNWDYNLKRKELMDKLIKHLAQVPQDIWAYKELQQLIGLDNIERGGDYGNDTLAYLGDLYMDLEDKNTLQKK